MRQKAGKRNRRRKGQRTAAARRPGAGAPRRWLRRLGGLPRWAQAALGAALVVVLASAVNWAVQVVRKPSELWFPVSGTLYKTPAETWHTYGELFRAHSTRRISPELLAALAQVEGSGNPVARTYWRWSLTGEPFDIYRPASSAVGMYQITDGTFAEARRYCVHDHEVVEQGPWHALDSCWFNALYTRVVPSHAIELTSAYLDRQVGAILARHPGAKPTPRQLHSLAALIHLCGAGAGDAYVRRGFMVAHGQRCADHDPFAYLRRVSRMQKVFAGLAAENEAGFRTGSNRADPAASHSSARNTLGSATL
jgi:Transglycosylase SLT domain